MIITINICKEFFLLHLQSMFTMTTFYSVKFIWIIMGVIFETAFIGCFLLAVMFTSLRRTRQTNSILSINWVTVEKKWQLSTILTNSNWDWEITITNASWTFVNCVYLFIHINNFNDDFYFPIQFYPFFCLHVHNNRVSEWHEYLFQLLLGHYF